MTATRSNSIYKDTVINSRDKIYEADKEISDIDEVIRCKLCRFVSPKRIGTEEYDELHYKFNIYINRAFKIKMCKSLEHHSRGFY